MSNEPISGCDQCATTMGRMGCPLHKWITMSRLSTFKYPEAQPVEPLPMPIMSAVASPFEARFAAILGPEIEACRAAQDAKYGGPEHDDTHQRVDWLMIIEKFTQRADRNSEDRPYRSADPLVYETALIDVAALAIAAVQSSRRKSG